MRLRPQWEVGEGVKCIKCICVQQFVKSLSIGYGENNMFTDQYGIQCLGCAFFVCEDQVCMCSALCTGVVLGG
jgi:hypothetical protein